MSAIEDCFRLDCVCKHTAKFNSSPGNRIHIKLVQMNSISYLITPFSSEPQVLETIPIMCKCCDEIDNHHNNDSASSMTIKDHGEITLLIKTLIILR